MTGSHEAIIDPATWEIVQAELARRSGKGTANTHPFANRIKCAECGGWYGRKVWHSTSKYRRYIWRCNNKYKPGYHCATTHITEQQIKDAFVQALTERINTNAVLDDVMSLLDDTVYNTTQLQAQQTKIAHRIEETITLINQLVNTCATTTHDPDEYDRRYQELETRHQQLENEHQKLTREIENLQRRRAQAVEAHEYLATQPPLEYSNQAWHTLIDHATITSTGDIHIHFKA